MSFLLNWLLHASVNGFLLGLPLCLAAKRIQHSGLRHAFYLTALAVFLAPPLWRPNLFPPMQPTQKVSPNLVDQPALELPVAALPPNLEELWAWPQLPPVETVQANHETNYQVWILGPWLSVSATLFLLALYRVVKMECLLRKVSRPSKNEQAEIELVALQAGLARPPLTLFHPGRMAPLVWALPFRSVLLLPTRFWRDLAQEKKRGILLHEFAHLRRGDFRVRWLELGLGLLFWWHPLVYWARAGLRQAEEELCDAFVLEHQPDESNSYAHALLDVIDFVSEVPAVAPGLASGIGSGHNLKRRLNMILDNSPKGKFSRWAMASLLGGGLILGTISILPGVSAQDEKRDPPTREQKDRPKDGERRKEADRPKDGDKPKDGERRKEADRPKDGDKPRGERPKDGDNPRGERRKEGDRPKDEPRGERPGAPGNPEQLEQARKEFAESREAAERAMERMRRAQQRLQELGGGPPQDEMARVLMEMRNQLEQMRKEINELRNQRGGPPREGAGGPRRDEGRPGGDRRPDQPDRN